MSDIMYGYVVVNKPELKFKEYDVYRSFYCGLCNALKDDAGLRGRMTISYDSTFLVLLLTGLYEPETTISYEKCIAHPFAKHQVRANEISQYVADMNLLLSYYKCIDDWRDEKKLHKKAFAGMILGKVKELEKKYPGKSECIKNSLLELSRMEAKGEDNIDKPAATFGKIISEIMVYKEDEWENSLRRMGDALGRFIYLIDAYDDMEKDEKKKNYNVLLLARKRKSNDDFDTFCENILKSYISVFAREFELLPIIENVDLLRNIVYSGVFTRFDIARTRRKNND